MPTQEEQVQTTAPAAQEIEIFAPAEGITTASVAAQTAVSPRSLTEKEKKEAEAKRKKRSAAKAYRERYFAYYDDVKTKIKEDW